MKFKRHWMKEGIEDHIIVEGGTIEDIREKAKTETDRRGLTEEKNNLWSKGIG